VELRATGEAIGLCGVVRRPGLDDADIGFALLERHAGLGFAREAAERVVRHAAEDLGFTRLAAITRPDNARSIALLEKLGMRFERPFRLPEGDEDLRLYVMPLAPPGR
jgi:RimJ/RimL family protein N-acetyltransferase